MEAIKCHPISAAHPAWCPSMAPSCHHTHPSLTLAMMYCAPSSTFMASFPLSLPPPSLSLSPSSYLPPPSLSLLLPSPSLSFSLSPPDSAWAVYIMPEEVGSRCQMIGRLILLLKGNVPNQSVGKLEIISPTDTGRPIVSWDRDKMRRTGKTGNLVFIEIGRRCQGGPGLVWMYAGFEEAHPLRETLHRSAVHVVICY